MKEIYLQIDFYIGFLVNSLKKLEEINSLLNFNNK
jgi:hypothetical protein